MRHYDNELNIVVKVLDKVKIPEEKDKRTITPQVSTSFVVCSLVGGHLKELEDVARLDLSFICSDQVIQGQLHRSNGDRVLVNCLGFMDG